MNSQKIKSLVKAGKPGRYTINKKRRELTLDKYPTMGLADAHAQTLQIKQDIRNKIDPIAVRRRAKIGIFHTVDDLAKDWLLDFDQ